MSKIRLNIEVSQELANLLDSLASKEDTTKADIVRRALSVVKAFDEQRERGRMHIGFASDPTRLESEILGILSYDPGSTTDVGFNAVDPGDVPVEADDVVSGPANAM